MCATCNDLYPWAALSTGAIAGAVLVDWHYLFLYMKVDDPLNAIGSKTLVSRNHVYVKFRNRMFVLYF